MENYISLIIGGVIAAIFGVFMWKVWPLIKDHAITKKALEIVHMMEEYYGSGTGKQKFEEAVRQLTKWFAERGWRVDVQEIMNIITAAVGVLHSEQGQIPAPKEEAPKDEDAEQLMMDGV